VYSAGLCRDAGTPQWAGEEHRFFTFHYFIILRPFSLTPYSKNFATTLPFSFVQLCDA